MFTIELIQELVILILLGRSIIMNILTNSISIQFLHFFGFNAPWARKGECWNVCWKPEHQNSLKWNLNRHLTEHIPSLEYTTTSTYHLYTLLKFSIVVHICKYILFSKAFKNFKIFDAKEQSSFLFLLQGFFSDLEKLKLPNNKLLWTIGTIEHRSVHHTVYFNIRVHWTKNK